MIAIYHKNIFYEKTLIPYVASIKDFGNGRFFVNIDPDDLFREVLDIRNNRKSFLEGLADKSIRVIYFDDKVAKQMNKYIIREDYRPCAEICVSIIKSIKKLI